MRALLPAILCVAVALGASNASAQYPTRPPQDYDDDYRYGYDREYEYDQFEDRPEFAMFGELRYYGRWTHHPHYGYVWRPFVRIGWRPFMEGHWIWTSHGWMWASYEPFGWATYHYGYWDYDFRFGWIWVPGWDWSPCRVTWVVYDDYVCWAPIAPPGVHFGYPWSRTRFNVWVSVPVYSFTDHDVGRHNQRVKYKSDYATRAVVRTAPERTYVERSAGTRLRETPVEFKSYKSPKDDGREVRRAVLPRSEERVVEKYRRDAPPQGSVERNRIEAPEKLRSTDRPRIPPPRVKAPASESSGNVERSREQTGTQPPATKEKAAKEKSAASSSKKTKDRNPRDR
jgi:hypothetical protein